jgi:hypothetical protein
MAADGEHLVSMLNISRPLIVCLARLDGTLTPWQFPDSWEDGVVQVRSPTTIEHLRAYPSQTHTGEWKADYPRRHLNASRDSFEVVWDPHDIGGRIDPMRLLNFRREQN